MNPPLFEGTPNWTDSLRAAVEGHNAVLGYWDQLEPIGFSASTWLDMFGASALIHHEWNARAQHHDLYIPRWLMYAVGYRQDQRWWPFTCQADQVRKDPDVLRSTQYIAEHPALVRIVQRAVHDRLVRDALIAAVIADRVAAFAETQFAGEVAP